MIYINGDHTCRNTKPKTIEAITEKAARQSLVCIDAFSVQTKSEDNLFLFGDHHCQSRKPSPLVFVFILQKLNFKARV